MNKAQGHRPAFTDDLQRDLELFQVLKPFIRHCLTLNHDINNPLSGIIGYCEFLQESAASLSQEQQGYVKQILACAERIQRQVEALCREKITLAEETDLAAFLDAAEKTSD